MEVPGNSGEVNPGIRLLFGTKCGKGVIRGMRLTRRDFLKLSGATAATAVISQLGLTAPASAKVRDFKILEAKATPTICPYCGVGCGQLVYVRDGKVVQLEGDPDNPHNTGSLCSKGSALSQVFDNPRRMTKVLYRAPGADAWEEKDWEWALDEIAKRVKATRDANFIETQADAKDPSKIYTANRTEAIASLGGASLDNEECYLLSKMNRALGIVYMEHQARI
jgi:formate dehydrogenase major subunit